jgi:predicted nucleic acid-binding protein
VIALLDTSILVAALVEEHPRHASAFSWLQRARRGDVIGVIAAHSIAEAFAVLTSLPLSPRIAPPTAWTLLERSVLSCCRAISLSVSDIRQVVSRVSRQGLAGGIVCDALIAEAGSKVRADRIVTLNPGDFCRVTDPSLVQEP